MSECECKCACGQGEFVSWPVYLPLARFDSSSKVMQYSGPESFMKIDSNIGQKTILVLPPRGRLLCKFNPYYMYGPNKINND